MTRVDAHHHFWDPARADYPWMTDALAPIRRAFGPDDLRPYLAAAGIDRTILVQTRASLDETREFLAISARTDFVAGVVGWVDLTSADIAAELAALRAGPGGTSLVGIRHQVHDEPDRDWLRRADVGRGLAAVEAAGLVFDLLVRERELYAAVDVVERFPNLRFVLDHIAKPPIATGVVPPTWVTGIQRLASRPNVWCKLSGLVTEADWQHWSIDDLRPYVAPVAHAFGPGRLLFGSDWPVCLLAASYERVSATARDVLAALGWDDATLDAVLGGNATTVYRL